ncbi:MAG: iron-sulfur cluster-binding domain-containing protein [Pseudomonadota bacterium]
MRNYLKFYDGVRRARSGLQTRLADNAPATPFWEGVLTVSDIITETPTIKTFRLSGVNGLLPFSFQAGQFVDLAVPVGGETLHRSYSISSSAYERRHIDLTIKRESQGAVSRELCDNLRVGDTLQTRGPFGQFVFDHRKSSRLLLIGAGVGVTPLVSMLRTLRDQNWRGEAHAVFGFRGEIDGLFLDELTQLSATNFKLILQTTWSAPENKHTKPKGRITPKFVKKSVKRLKDTTIFICGPTGMMDDLQQTLPRYGVSPERIHIEAFSPPPVDESLGGAFEIHFAPTGVLAVSKAGESILDVAERTGVAIDYSCRNGSCGLCAATLKAGEVEMMINDVLEDDEINSGMILTCQSFPRQSCKVSV